MQLRHMKKRPIFHLRGAKAGQEICVHQTSYRVGLLNSSSNKRLVAFLLSILGTLKILKHDNKLSNFLFTITPYN